MTEKLTYREAARLQHGRRLHRAGWGLHLGMDEPEYLATIPELPSFPVQIHQQRFRTLVLVDERLALNEMHGTLGVNAESMRHHDNDDRIEWHRQNGRVYWIICDVGWQYVELPPDEALTRMQADETSLSELQAMCLYAQWRWILDDRALLIMDPDDKEHLPEAGGGIVTFLHWRRGRHARGSFPQMYHYQWHRSEEWRHPDNVITPTQWTRPA